MNKPKLTSEEKAERKRMRELQRIQEIERQRLEEVARQKAFQDNILMFFEELAKLAIPVAHHDYYMESGAVLVLSLFSKSDYLGDFVIKSNDDYSRYEVIKNEIEYALQREKQNKDQIEKEDAAFEVFRQSLAQFWRDKFSQQERYLIVAKMERIDPKVSAWFERIEFTC